jgi:hypothetical protein
MVRLGLGKQVRREPADLDRGAEMIGRVAKGRIGRHMGREGRIEISDYAN